VDTRPAAEFAAVHLPGTINIPLNSLGEWAGWLVDYERPLYLITSEQRLAGVVKLLAKLGIDRVAGYWESSVVTAAGLATDAYRTATAEELAGPILNGGVRLLDIRAQTEWDAGHLPNAEHIMLGYLPAQAAAIASDTSKPIVVQCRTGRRSAIAASILKAEGAQEVINMIGGYRDWAGAGLPLERGE
jgi:hydroxyacylglutathione hydrolase